MKLETYASRLICELGRKLARNIPGVRRGRTMEPVHQMRVTARRLHNAFWVFKDFLPRKQRQQSDKAVRHLLKVLSPVRDLDVQISNFLKQSQQEKDLQLEPASQEYLRHLLLQRRQLQPQVLKALGPFDDRDIFSLEAVHPPVDFDSQEETAAFIGKKVRRLLKEVLVFEPIVPNLRKIKELHQLRIAAKHLRYTLECFVPLFPGELEPLIADILKLHDLLGDIHDRHVWACQVRDFAKTQKKDAPFKILAEQLDQAVLSAHQDFVLAWKRVSQRKTWKKIQAFSFFEGKAQ